MKVDRKTVRIAGTWNWNPAGKTMDSHKVWRERKQTRCNNWMFIINFCLNMFRASLCPSSGEQRPCVTAYGVLRWFCWMWLVAVVGRWVVGCEHCEGYCSTVLLKQKMITNIWLLHLVGFLFLHTLLTIHGHMNLKDSHKLTFWRRNYFFNFSTPCI